MYLYIRFDLQPYNFKNFYTKIHISFSLLIIINFLGNLNFNKYNFILQNQK